MRYIPCVLAAPFVQSALAQVQIPPAEVQSTSFNSSFTLSPSQIESANLSRSVAQSVQNVINFDRSQLAYGGPHEDDFYTLPPLNNETGPLEPGVLLKVQPFTDPNSFSIPPNTGLSRILYTTTNLNGTVIPASAYVLWPYLPRHFPTSGDASTCKNGSVKAPVVLWTHGTSGFFATQAPSAHRSLWYGHDGPFALALDGYAVVAPDYAGLGISKSWDGSEIPHQYLAAPASAYDALYGLRAALEAFPDILSRDFVAMGHSQGGGVAWAVAEALANQKSKFADLIPGYKGTIAASPTTDLFTGVPEFILSWVGMMLHSIFPSFQLEEWLTPLGIARTQLLKEVEGGIGVGTQLYLTSDEAIVRSDYNQTWYADAYGKLANPGGKDFAGPMLVMQGTNDIYVQYDVTSKTVNRTWELYPGNDLEYLVVSGVGHVPVLDATRHIWLQWIRDRFEGKDVKNSGSHRTDIESFLPIDQYLSAGNSFLQWAGSPEYSYQTPLGP